MSVYKPCDIRGDVAQLSASLYARWGQSLARRLEPGADFLVGGDVRLTTPAFRDALIDGLCAAGMRVRDLGTLPTPMVYFAKRHFGAPACAIVTASHNPPQVNGLKWMVGDFPATEAEVAALRRDAEDPAFPADPRPHGSRASFDIAGEYLHWLRDAVPGGESAAGRVVLDPGNGCWSGRALTYLHALFPGVQLTAIHDREDGSFPNRNADCARPEYLQALCAAVREQQADLGIAFDGDGDRVAFVDHEGHALSAEEATWVLLQSYREDFSGRAFVYDIKFSDRLREGVCRLGGLPCMERSGHAFIRRRMLDEGALFGAEISGHYFYGALDGGDDGLFTAARLLAYLAACGQSLAALRRTCPPIFLTPDLRITCTHDEQQQMLDAIRDAFRDNEQTAIDGVRITFPHGWALMRSSVTEAALTFRFEADTSDALDHLVAEFCRRLPSYGDQVLATYRTACPA